jgi:hypothetical protein
MTDRLMTLLHSEAETLDVPPVPAAEILGAGRRLRRRRTRTIWATAALAVAVVAGGSVVAAARGDGHPTPPVTATPSLMAWASGDTVYVGSAGRPARMPEVAQTLYYTSAGVLVRTNKDGSSDGGAPFHFELVRADAVATKLDLTLGDVVPSTDPAQPYLAWATMTDGQIQVVVRDVTTDRDVATVDVPGTFSWGGWEAPPVSLSGDQVYVATDHKAEVVDWRTGQTHPSDVVPGSTYLTISGGHILIWRKDTVEVLDADSGKVLFHLEGSVNDAELSPDGRFAVISQAGQDQLHDLASGATSRVPLSSYGWANTEDQVYRVEGSTLTTCSTSTSRCHDSSVPPVGKNVLIRYAGRAFES